MASRKTDKYLDPAAPDFDVWWPIHGSDGVYDLIVELGGGPAYKPKTTRRSTVPKMFDELPTGRPGNNGYWWWRYELVNALRTGGRVPPAG